MSKATKYGINGALIGGFVNAALNAIKQQENNPDVKLDWNQILKAGGKGAIVGGATGLLIGSAKDSEMTETMLATGGTLGLMKEMLNEHSDNEQTLPIKASKIQAKLHKEFKDSLSEYPSLNGSVIKGTAIQGSDIDIQLKFNRDSGNIDEMTHKIETFFGEVYNDKHFIQLRKQNHSIGLIFDVKGEEKRIDIVPMREVDNGKGDTYIYSSRNNSIKKTNTSKQKNDLRFTEKQKKVIKLLKIWKSKNDLLLPSILLELMVKRAFSERQVPRGLDKTLLFMIKYLADNITIIRVVDPSNSNNILSDVLSSSDKKELKSYCTKMLDEIDLDSKNILDYFDVMR